MVQHSIKQFSNYKARGRNFSSRELAIIAKVLESYFDEGRTKISQRICKALSWRQPNGRLKEVACREVLRKLDKTGFIQLPSPRSQGASWNKRTVLKSDFLDTTKITSIDFKKVRIEKALNKSDRELWNNLVSQHHYLYSSRIVGRQIKYLVFIKDLPIACLGWGDASWMVKARDKWIGWTYEEIMNNRHLIINNVRFLILPWVKVPNLASHLLAKCSGAVIEDWYKTYGFRPVLLETFVDISRFSGTCYRAANWIDLGITAGYSKVGSSHKNSQEPKAIFVFPVKRNFCDQLRYKRN